MPEPRDAYEEHLAWMLGRLKSPAAAKAEVVVEGNYIVSPSSPSKPCPVCRETHFVPEKSDCPLARRTSKEPKEWVGLYERYFDSHPPEKESFTFASDAEREEVVQRLRAAGAEGRLTPEALEHRVAQALRTCTREGLPALLEGLPKEELAKRPKIKPCVDECRTKTAEKEATVGDVIVFMIAIGLVIVFVWAGVTAFHAVFG